MPQTMVLFDREGDTMKVISSPQTERHLNSPVALMCRPRMGTDLPGREGAKRTSKMQMLAVGPLS